MFVRCDHCQRWLYYIHDCFQSRKHCQLPLAKIPGRTDQTWSLRCYEMTRGRLEIGKRGHNLQAFRPSTNRIVLSEWWIPLYQAWLLMKSLRALTRTGIATLSIMRICVFHIHKYSFTMILPYEIKNCSFH